MAALPTPLVYVTKQQELTINFLTDCDAQLLIDKVSVSLNEYAYQI